MNGTRLLACLKQIGGTVAMFACRQSPYGVPDNLVTVLQAFYVNARPNFDADGWREFQDRAEVERCVARWLSGSGFEAWNEPKIPSGARFVFVSRYGGPPPDHDFIDLDALLRNVGMEIEKHDQRERSTPTHHPTQETTP